MLQFFVFWLLMSIGVFGSLYIVMSLSNFFESCISEKDRRENQQFINNLCIFGIIIWSTLPSIIVFVVSKVAEI